MHLINSDDPTTSTTAKCYVNGSLVGSTTHSRTLVAGTYGYNSIGNRGSDTSQLYGNIYYVRFWNGTEITANQVSALYNNRYNTYLYKNTGPSKYYLLGEFDNKATTVFADSSANYPYNSVVYFPNLPTAVYAWDFRVATSTSVNDLVNNATATYYQTSSTVEDGLAFTGQNAHATIPAGILINSGPSEVSWEIYFKYTTALGSWDMILHLSLNSNNDLRFAQYGIDGYFTFRYGNVSPTNIGSDSDVNQNTK